MGGAKGDAPASASTNPSAAPSGKDHGRGRILGGLVLKALCVAGGALLVRKLANATTLQQDHSRKVFESLIGIKFSSEQALGDPENYFNLRLNACPAAELVDGSKFLYVEQAFWRTPEKPYRQRFFKVKASPKGIKSDVDVSSYAVRDMEEYKNFCERPKDQRPQPSEVLGNIAELLTTIHLSRCGKEERCLYKGSTPPGGFPNSWNGATSCTSDLTIFKDGEIHCWDRGYNDEGSQVWGVQKGPYEFKPVT